LSRRAHLRHATICRRRIHRNPSVERTETTHFVVLFALLRIAQNVVRFRDFLEALRCLRVGRVRIGMVLLRELAVGLLDFVLGGAGTYAEYGVESFVCAMWSARERGQPFHCFTTTRAGRSS